MFKHEQKGMKDRGKMRGQSSLGSGGTHWESRKGVRGIKENSLLQHRVGKDLWISFLCGRARQSLYLFFTKSNDLLDKREEKKIFFGKLNLSLKGRR